MLKEKKCAEEDITAACDPHCHGEKKSFKTS